MMGACRTHELPEIRMQHIKRYDDMYYVSLPKEFTKTGEPNSFAIMGQMFHIVDKYEKLCPGHVQTDRFFLNFQKGKCTIQTIGEGEILQNASSYCRVPQFAEPTFVHR